jgi:hypothetical protein
MNTASSGKQGSLRGKLAAGAALGLIALGIWFGMNFRGPGLGGSGTDDGAGEGAGGEATRTGSGDDSPTNVSVAVDGDAPLAARPETPDGAGPATLQVMVYESGYRLPKALADSASADAATADQFAPATLEQVVAQAQAAKGNESGIKVLILLHKSSTVGARNDLVKALQDAGLRDSEIHQRTGRYVD